MLRRLRGGIVAMVWILMGHAACAADLPVQVQSRIPAGYDVIADAQSDLNGDSHADFIIALARPDEQEVYDKTGKAPSRPLLMFMSKADGSFAAPVRNDDVVFTLDQGGQCDPFNDGYDGIVAKGRYFTVQNGVACGEHWTDFVTFKYDTKLHAMLFYKEIYQSWKMNDSNDPNAEALVLDTTNVERADIRKPVDLAGYKSK